MFTTNFCASAERSNKKTAFSGRKSSNYTVETWYNTNIEYRSIAHLFGVGLSTVCVTVREVCNAIVNTLFQRYIKIPTGQSAETVVDGFCIDGDFHNVLGRLMALIFPSLHLLETTRTILIEKGGIQLFYKHLSTMNTSL